ncbi:MAG TPA: DUF4232 domain-containing protein [Gaiellaceae bacterium]|nr:DUF4232 domain-containing protein [Gaiellaceae bacterium]
MRRSTLLALLVCSTAVAAAPAGATHTTAACKGPALTGRFAAVPGSAGAGNIVYALVLKNRSTSTCAVTGLPQLTLLGKRGKTLPTHVRADQPNQLTAVLVRLAPGHSARATARFSPDVPGPGEPVRAKSCELPAYRAAVHAPGGGRVIVPVAPPTPVCEHGQLLFRAYRLVR